MSYYVAAYDIRNHARRARVAEVLLEHGRRIQRSVYEIDLSPEDLDDLRFRVGLLLARTDLFDLFPIDRRFPKRRISWQRDPVPPDPVIVLE
jgi:CRISPR-associated endonuclease Cas2